MSDDKPAGEKPEAEMTGVASDAPVSKPAHDPVGSVQTTESTPTKAEASDMQIASGGKPDEPTKRPSDADRAKTVAAAHTSHDRGAHDHGDDHGHGLAHTMPVWMLIAVLGALLVLTVATVAVTAVDLGAQGNLIVAMVIATVKAILVCTFFMHLLWDKKFNLVLFLTSVLFLILFLAMATTDRGEYQQSVDDYRAQQLGK
ncbi:MAG: caa(3)-type oxidase, subunit [Polyangiaceae bacterium]|jgi:cytochrome c oxidase subunit 4|nr:caa(3)-type oxidase, subunit [Polyangiaceae bacterium]